MSNLRAKTNLENATVAYRLQALLVRMGPAIGLIAVWLLFASLNGSGFTQWSNHRLMLLQTAVVATAAIGGTLVIISGGIDLSVGSGIALGTMVIAWLLKFGIAPWLIKLGVGPWIAVIGGVAIGFFFGATIGAMIVGRLPSVIGFLLGIGIGYALVGQLPFGIVIGIGGMAAIVLAWLGFRFGGRIQLTPFIVTLGMWGALRGAAKGLGDNQPIHPDETWLTNLMQPAPSGLFHFLAPGVWLMILLTILMAGVLRYTRFGRHVYAIGSNEETARLCGVAVERTKLWVYGLASMFTAVAAILQFAYLSLGDPTTAEGYELKVIASVVIGGASLSGGQGTVFGTLIGALIMTIVDNGCTKLGLDNWVQEIVTGGIILGAVALDQIRHRRYLK